jgi:hypothetical protein
MQDKEARKMYAFSNHVALDVRGYILVIAM